MLNINRILLATNLKEEGTLAPLTLTLAQAVNASVHVVHALHEHDAPITADAVAAWFRKHTEELAEQDLISLSFGVIHDSDAATALMAYAEAHAIDLVVVGSYRRDEGAPMRSIAERFIRHTLLPVLVCTSTPWEGLRTMMAPVDFSKPARHAFLHAYALAEVTGARLDVVHAMRGMASSEAMELAIPALRASVASFCANALGRDAEVHVGVRPGDPATCITELAREQDTDLLVLQTHGLAGLSRVALGSVAKRVLHRAPCAILMLRTFGHSLLDPAARYGQALRPV
ncbi:MAG: universal stress protein [Rhodothermales bacterium]